jgi:hypothetical protein
MEKKTEGSFRIVAIFSQRDDGSYEQVESYFTESESALPSPLLASSIDADRGPEDF